MAFAWWSLLKFAEDVEHTADQEGTHAKAVQIVQIKHSCLGAGGFFSFALSSSLPLASCASLNDSSATDHGSKHGSAPLHWPRAEECRCRHHCGKHLSCCSGTVGLTDKCISRIAWNMTGMFRITLRESMMSIQFPRYFYHVCKILLMCLFSRYFPTIYIYLPFCPILRDVAGLA